MEMTGGGVCLVSRIQRPALDHLFGRWYNLVISQQTCRRYENWEKRTLGRYDDENRIRIRFTTHAGKVTRIEIVQYEAYLAGKWRPLVRYDTAHGYLHRDVMKPDGTQEKMKIPYTSLSEALTQAIDEIRRQWRFYRRVWEEEMK